jgi:hypothetical protein
MGKRTGRDMVVCRDNCWLPIQDFPKIKREVQNERERNFKIRYFVMMKLNGEIVSNWFVSKEAGWFFGNPMHDFVAWAEIRRPSDDR